MSETVDDWSSWAVVEEASESNPRDRKVNSRGRGGRGRGRGSERSRSERRGFFVANKFGVHDNNDDEEDGIVEKIDDDLDCSQVEEGEEHEGDDHEEMNFSIPVINSRGGNCRSTRHRRARYNEFGEEDEDENIEDDIELLNELAKLEAKVNEEEEEEEEEEDDEDEVEETPIKAPVSRKAALLSLKKEKTSSALDKTASEVNISSYGDVTDDSISSDVHLQVTLPLTEAQINESRNQAQFMQRLLFSMILPPHLKFS